MTMAASQALTGLTLPIPADTLEAIAQRTAEIILNHTQYQQPGWMTRQQAAEYLSVPLSRLEKDRTLPSHRWGGRVLYNRGELDEYLLGLEAA
jgi:excisionase family DNA binding protein